MPAYAIKPMLIAIAVTVWLKFLLPATGWLFYELHHATGFDWVYRGYTVFRGGGYWFGNWPHQTLTCVTLGLFLFMLLARRGKRRSMAEG